MEYDSEPDASSALINYADGEKIPTFLAPDSVLTAARQGDLIGTRLLT